MVMDTLHKFPFHMSTSVLRPFSSPTQAKYVAYIGWPIHFTKEFTIESSSFLKF